MILSRVRLLSQQRLDLVDFNAMLSGVRTDSKLWTKQFLSDSAHIIKGFAVTGLGASTATINMANATLIHGSNTSDFSYFVAESGASNITVLAADLVDNTRNYVELKLQTATNTSASRTFWDPNNSVEFASTIDTMTDLEATYEVSTGSFSGSSDKIPLAIIDVDSGGLIKQIFDERSLFFRLGTGSNPSNNFSWSSQEEPVFTATLTGGSGTYTAGETITFAGVETATVVTGGTTSITFRLPSAKTFSSGDTVVGGSSSASRTLSTVIESFTGADKDISDFKDVIDAIMTEVKSVKGTDFWHQNTDFSISELITQINSIMVQNVGTARFEWSGSELSLTDNSGSAADSDVIALLKKFGSSQSLTLTRQDSASSTISISDGEVLFVKLPSTGDRAFSSTGSGTTNYQTVAVADFVNSGDNYWLGIRSGTKLYLRGLGELDAGDSKEISESDSDLKPPFALTATGTPDLVLNVGPGEVTDPTVGNSVGFAPINRKRFTFSSGTVTFPSSSGGTITVSPGTNGTLTLSSGNFMAILIQIDSDGNLSVVNGTEAATKAAAINATNFPLAGENERSIGYVVVENDSGTIQNIENVNITQFISGDDQKVRSNLSATTDPGVSDDQDSNPGYAPGSMWINLTLDRIFFCLDASSGAAVWSQLGTGGGGGGDVLYLAKADDNTIGIFDDTGNNATYGNGGTITSGALSLDTTAANLLVGDTNVFSYIPGADGSNDFWGKVIDIPKGLRGRHIYMIMEYKTDSTYSDNDILIQAEALDGTSSGLLSDTTSSFGLLKQDATNDVGIRSAKAFLCPSDCTQISFGFINTSSTTTIELYFDRFEITVDPRTVLNYNHGIKRASVKQNEASVSIAHNAVTYLGWANTDSDPQNAFTNIGNTNSTTNTSATYWTCPKSGDYLVNLQAYTDDSDWDAGEDFNLKLRNGTTTFATSSFRAQGTQSSPKYTATINKVFSFTKGDIITSAVVHTAVGGISMTSDDGNSWFSFTPIQMDEPESNIISSTQTSKPVRVEGMLGLVPTGGSGSFLGWARTTYDESGMVQNIGDANHASDYTATTYIEVPHSDYYLITAQCQFADIDIDANHLGRLEIYVNGVAKSLTQERITASATSPTRPWHIDDRLYLQAGDKLSLRFYQNSGSNWDTETTANYAHMTVKQDGHTPVLSAIPSAVVAAHYQSEDGQALTTSDGKITYEEKVLDTHEAYTGGVYTFPLDGWFNVSAAYATTGASISRAEIKLYHNSTTYIAGGIDESASGTYSRNPNFNITRHFAQGDTIEFRADVSGAETMRTSIRMNHMSISKVIFG